MKIGVMLFASLLLALVPTVALADTGMQLGRWNQRQAASTTLRITLASGVSSVTVVPPGGSSQLAAECANLAEGWASPLQGTDWISTHTDCAAGLSTGDFVYTVTFNLPGNAGPLRISGSVLADDSVTVRLNGNQLFSGGGFTQSSAFASDVSSLFVAGSNALTFIVHNTGGGPSGLDFSVNILAGAAAVQPVGVGNHGQCVSAVAHGTARGSGHGQAVSYAARFTCR